MSPPAFQRAERLARRLCLVHSFRRLTLRSATGTAQRAIPTNINRGAIPLWTISATAANNPRS